MENFDCLTEGCTFPPPHGMLRIVISFYFIERGFMKNMFAWRNIDPAEELFQETYSGQQR